MLGKNNALVCIHPQLILGVKVQMFFPPFLCFFLQVHLFHFKSVEEISYFVKCSIIGNIIISYLNSTYSLYLRY